MGAGSFTATSYAAYNSTLGRAMDKTTLRVSGQEFKARYLDKSLDPKEFTVRECVNTEEHPNTIPVILALDVTGSMGPACSETAAALGTIIKNLYTKFKDIEFCIMGIGDLAYDSAPIQMSQFESDIRIAEALDKVYIEHGGGGNGFESYTAAWYMGLKRTKLDCFDKQGRKGIIITMGDEPLNPYLPKEMLNADINASEESNIETSELFKQASQKFDIFHIGVTSHSSFHYYEKEIANTFGQLLESRYKASSINELSKAIEDCITEAITGVEAQKEVVNQNGEISW